MAFTFTVETGAGVAGANSYVSVAEADDYYAVDPNFNATWTAYDTAAKEQRLAWSTRVLDQRCLFEGDVVTSGQALRWPRAGVYTKDHTAITNTTIPRQLKDAVLEHLKYAITNDPTVGSDVTNLSQIVVDVIELTYQEGTSQSNVPVMINHILDGIGFYIIGARGSAKIIKS